MLFKATPEFALKFTKLIALLGTSWPNYEGTPKWKLVVFQIRWWSTFFLAITACLTMCYAACNQYQNILNLTKSLFDISNTSQTFVKMFFCKVHYKRMQYLLCDMEKYVTKAKPHERDLFIKYIKRCGKLHLTVMGSGLLIIHIIILAPIALPQPFPNIAEYPFPIDGHPTYELLYLHQSCATIHCLSIPAFDCQIAMLLWYAGARLELLSEECKTITDNKQFVECIKQHQYLLWYIQEITTSSRHILATTGCTCILTAISSGVHIVSNEPVAFKVPFMISWVIVSSTLYITSWPAENVLQMCEQVGMALYESPWVQNSKELNSSILFVVQRSQKPSTIEVPGILPVLSLRYFAMFLSRTFSYFTTLRVLLDKINLDMEIPAED
uniref:Odorant receptor n=1 Tax=Microplitis mediator TaxID=375433 RepID=A0A0H4K7I3_9HYME|nr:odorant receptor 30 [Microplitis mediator]